MRSLLAKGPLAPGVFRDALTRVLALDRDAWLDHVLALEEVPEDGPELPRGGVPYLPCPVDAVVRLLDEARVDANDVFVDVGAGLGRATTLAHLLTGASAIGVEIQPALVREARALAARVGASRVKAIEGDAATLAARLPIATVFFLYCPFSDARLETLVDGLESLSATRPLRVCCVDVALPERPWLRCVSRPGENLALYVSQ